MSKTYRSYDPNQQCPLSVAMREWLHPDHLDLSAITSVYERQI